MSQGFTKVPNDAIRQLAKLSDGAFRLLVTIMSYDWERGNGCTASMETLAEHMGCTRVTASRRLADLKKAKLVDVTPVSGGTSVIRVTSAQGVSLAIQGCNTGDTGGCIADDTGVVSVAIQGCIADDTGVVSLAIHEEDSGKKTKEEDQSKTPLKSPKGDGDGGNMLGETPDDPKRKAQVIAEQFELFWSDYPRKVGKAKALKAWRKLGARDRKAAIEGATVMGEVWAHASAERKQYIPHPTTWLGQGRWTDDRSEWHRMATGSSVGVAYKGELGEWQRLKADIDAAKARQAKEARNGS